MNPESLQALLTDRELGELPSEAVELLDLWLAEHPEAAASIPSLRRTLDLAGAAVRRYPELSRPEADAIPLRVAQFRWMPLALAASVLMLLGGASWLGFHAGQGSAPAPVAEVTTTALGQIPANAPQAGDPWARYALVPDARGGVTIVRLDPFPQP